MRMSPGSRPSSHVKSTSESLRRLRWCWCPGWGFHDVHWSPHLILTRRHFVRLRFQRWETASCGRVCHCVPSSGIALVTSCAGRDSDTSISGRKSRLLDEYSWLILMGSNRTGWYWWLDRFCCRNDWLVPRAGKTGGRAPRGSARAKQSVMGIICPSHLLWGEGGDLQ